MRIAVVGGTGSFGRALARRLIEADYEVVIGSRDEARAREVAAEIRAVGATNAGACEGADLVVIATKAEGALAAVDELATAIGETPVLSVAAELQFGPVGVAPTLEATSIASRIQERVRGPVIAGLHSLAARNLGGDDAPQEDVLVCGDDVAAKELVLELAERITAGRAIDCGPLASARALEGLTAVIINVNRRYKAHAGVRLSGIP